MISLDDVSKQFAPGMLALDSVSLKVDAGEFVSIVGPSGCGKSTVLRLLAGLDRPTGGTVNSPALALNANGTDTAVVFQDATLMPWASVFDNVWLPLRLQGISRKQASEAVRQVLAAVGLSDSAASLPSQLSGGMKMRASIARALITEPKVLLMDEPFAALDEITRQRLNAELLDWWYQRRMTTLFVTHNVYEAVFLSQRIIVMSARPGRVVASFTISEDYPRTQGFRSSLMYSKYCSDLHDALESAHARQTASR